ncbi:MAG: bifunctional GNAT family N-acetyltransferase/carbon-nitrogen hydrolase family protein [Leptospiraceae bacterium]|nr:bifunctional GNAT family N-acetyltransferase/carbon-nitrogen hydrolase family protein [Leptospiraceae bacterium]
MDKELNPNEKNQSDIESKTSEITHRLNLRNTERKDFHALKELLELVYDQPPFHLTEETFQLQIEKFPEGQYCIEDNGKPVAFAISMIVQYSDFGDKHKYRTLTSDGSLSLHNPEGDILYGVETIVHPDFQGLRLGRRLYAIRKEICEKMNLKKIILGGRTPGFQNYKDKMSPHEYVKKVGDREIYDRVLSFQFANDFHVRKIVMDYFSDESHGGNFSPLLEWINIYYEEKEVRPGGHKSVIRLGVVQWQMRSVGSMEEFLKQIEFFVDAVSGYNADFVLFPEFFNVPLMAKFNHLNPADAIRKLAEYTEEIRNAMLNMAVSYNINIISGSMPILDEGSLKNVAYLLRRDGTWEKQFKIHITPDELGYWGLKGGSSICVFDTDVCKIGILICFDVEFPELPRLLSENEMEILFVPFSTDTKNAYHRVRLCAQARAIENECYVAISGSVGNLPDVENMDIQYAQSAVFTPSDFAFSQDAIAAEATPNTEMTLVVDVDLDLLKELKTHGSVRNMNSRRKDLYKISWTGQDQ